MGAMYHVIEFVENWWAELERAPGQPLERVLLRRGARRRAQVRPHVVARRGGPVEAADLLFEDGTATRDVPFACITFPD
jgi:hypothetical protein